MQTSKVLVYEPETIQCIGSNITATLAKEVIDSLMEIKINNRFIRRRSPIKLKYTMNKSVAATWRNEKENKDAVSDENRFSEKLNTELNKLSESNFEIIKDALKSILQSNSDELYRDLAIESLFSKSINETTYSFLYAKLLDMIIDVYGQDVKKMILDRVESFYSENIDKKFATTDPNITYDKLCELNKEKSKLLGSFTFIGGLYANNIVDFNLVIKYYDILVNTILNVEINEQETLDKYVECLSTLLNSIGKKLENQLGEQFDEKIMNNIREIVANKAKFKPRTRFMVMDIIDNQKRGW